MADYTAESRLFTPEGMLRGPTRSGNSLRRCSKSSRSLAPPSKWREVDGDTAYIMWKAETADHRFELGTDTFVIQNGKIATATFAGKISPKH